MAVDLKDRRLLRALAVTLVVGTAASAGPARAQFFGWSGWDNGGGWGGMPGPQVRRSISEQGFRVLGPLRRNGNVFVADVIDPRGRHERLIVASSDAQILQRFYVDDGRGAGPGPFARGDDEGGLVPPADIPGGPRVRVSRPRPFETPGDQAEPARRFAPPDAEGRDTAVVEPPPLHGQPPIRTVKPTPRVVERVPEAPQRREPAAVDATPLAPVAPRPRTVEPPVRAAVPKTPPAAVASRPDAAPPASAAPASAPASPQRRLTDPLAIPGGSAKSAEPAPVRSVSGSVTGAPAAAAKPAEGAVAKPAETAAPKAGDVPAAPLD